MPSHGGGSSEALNRLYGSTSTRLIDAASERCERPSPRASTADGFDAAGGIARRTAGGLRGSRSRRHYRSEQHAFGHRDELGTEVEWPTVGIGFGIGLVLALGLYLAMRVTRTRPLAH